jgi:hypothetical protein
MQITSKIRPEPILIKTGQRTRSDPKSFVAISEAVGSLSLATLYKKSTDTRTPPKTWVGKIGLPNSSLDRQRKVGSD